MSTTELNLAQLEFWDLAPEERHRVFAELRTWPEPLFCPTGDGAGFYALTRYDEIQTVSRTPEIFSSEPISTSLDDPPADVMQFAGSIISLDAPRHTRLRRIVARMFTPRMVEEATEATTKIARDILRDLDGRQSCDFVTDIAALMPLRMMCRILGVPDELEQEVIWATGMIVAQGDPEFTSPYGNSREDVLVAKYQHLHDLMRDLARMRKARPTDDLATKMMTANIDGELLTEEEIGKFFTLLIVAGSETARNTLAHALALLSAHPDQHAMLLADLPARLPAAIEEVIRYSTPTTWMRRNLTREFRLRDHTFQAADRVVMFYNSANRDESVFTEPDTFDILRSPNPHLGFGSQGPHFCLGAHLARHEIGVMLRELFHAVPDIHVTAPPVRQRASFVNGIASLPCAFSSPRLGC